MLIDPWVLLVAGLTILALGFLAGTAVPGRSFRYRREMRQLRRDRDRLAGRLNRSEQREIYLLERLEAAEGGDRS